MLTELGQLQAAGTSGQDGPDKRCGHPGDGIGGAPGVLGSVPFLFEGTEVQPPGLTASISKPEALASGLPW